MLYRRVTSPVTLNDHNRQTTPISTFCIAFNIFVVGEHRDFKFCAQVGHTKFWTTEDKQSLKGA